jgi:hypothetical protein
MSLGLRERTAFLCGKPRQMIGNQTGLLPGSRQMVRRGFRSTGTTSVSRQTCIWSEGCSAFWTMHDHANRPMA